MLKAVRFLGVLAVCFAVFIVAMRLAFPLPERPEATGLGMASPQVETGLGEILAPLAAAHPGTSGIVTLNSGSDAFAARIHLARAATTSIDAQYYIWDDDLTGIRLLTELQQAAQRGVHVRLLVDDNGTPSLDQELAALDALPTAEVRIFNPFTLRSIGSSIKCHLPEGSMVIVLNNSGFSLCRSFIASKGVLPPSADWGGC